MTLRPRLLPLALALVLALGVSACSDDEPDDPTPSSASTPDDLPPVSSATPTIQTLTPEPPEPEETTEPVTPTATPDPDGLPTTYEEGLARFDAATPSYVELERFVTPDDTYCLLRSDFFVGCELGSGQGIPDPDYCGDGASSNVGRISLTSDSVTAECNTDTIREGGAEVIPVGGAGSSTLNGIRCLVEEVGVTCVDDLRSQGFFIGPERYIVFAD